MDFSDPANPKQLGFFVPTGGNTWSAKPHRGFIFTGDIIRGMDVLLYTGEGGNAWPTTSGAAELQRGATQATGPGTGKPRTDGPPRQAPRDLAPGAPRRPPQRAGRGQVPPELALPGQARAAGARSPARRRTCAGCC